MKVMFNDMYFFSFYKYMEKMIMSLDQALDVLKISGEERDTIAKAVKG